MLSEWLAVEVVVAEEGEGSVRVLPYLLMTKTEWLCFVTGIDERLMNDHGCCDVSVRFSRVLRLSSATVSA